MSHTQADALSRILDEMATKNALGLLRQEVRSELREIRTEIRESASALKADLTWRFLTMMGFFAVGMTTVDMFVD